MFHSCVNIVEGRSGSAWFLAHQHMVFVMDKSLFQRTKNALSFQFSYQLGGLLPGKLLLLLPVEVLFFASNRA